MFKWLRNIFGRKTEGTLIFDSSAVPEPTAADRSEEDFIRQMHLLANADAGTRPLRRKRHTAPPPRTAATLRKRQRSQSQRKASAAYDDGYVVRSHAVAHSYGDSGSDSCSSDSGSSSGGCGGGGD